MFYTNVYILGPWRQLGDDNEVSPLQHASLNLQNPFVPSFFCFLACWLLDHDRNIASGCGRQKEAFIQNKVMVPPLNPYAKKSKSHAARPLETTSNRAYKVSSATIFTDPAPKNHHASDGVDAAHSKSHTQRETKAPAAAAKHHAPVSDVSSTPKPVDVLVKSERSHSSFIDPPTSKPLSLKAMLKQDIEKLKRETQQKQLLMEERKRRKKLERMQREEERKSKLSGRESSEHVKHPAEAAEDSRAYNEHVPKVNASIVQEPHKSTGSVPVCNEITAMTSSLEKDAPGDSACPPERPVETPSVPGVQPHREVVVHPGNGTSHVVCMGQRISPVEDASSSEKVDNLSSVPRSNITPPLEASQHDHVAIELSPPVQKPPSVELCGVSLHPNPPPVVNPTSWMSEPTANLTVPMARQLMLSQQFWYHQHWHHQQMALHSACGFYNPYCIPLGAPSFSSPLPTALNPTAAIGPSHQFSLHRNSMPAPFPTTFSANQAPMPRVDAPHKVRRSYSKAPGDRRLPLPRVSTNHALSMNPLRSPSPFAATHHPFSAPIVILKPAGEPSFGVTVKLEVQTALVSRDWLVQNKLVASDRVIEAVNGVKPPHCLQQPLEQENSATNEAEPNLRDYPIELSVPHCEPVSEMSVMTSLVGNAVRKPQQRRKRWPFYAIAVQDASIQNARNPAVPTEQLLRAGDLLLEINGQTTAGLTFQEAVNLLKKFNETDPEGIARCRVVVARQAVRDGKKRTPVPSKTSSSARHSAVTDEELCRFACSLIKSTADSKRVLGMELTDETILARAGIELSLPSSNLHVIMMAWNARKRQFESDLIAKAAEHWKKLWASEPAAVRVPGVDYITDAQRASLRSLPQPALGCKCGATDHQYVFDENCPLYSNLRSLAPAKLSLTSAGRTASTLESKLPKDLNVVERAFTDRFLKLKDEQKAMERVSRFVVDAEEVQLKLCKQASVAPALGAMVLSTVVELQEHMKALKFQPFEATTVDHSTGKASIVARSCPAKLHQGITDSGRNESVCHDDSDDDDDVPLAALGKRPGTNDNASFKKPKVETSIRSYFLARLLKDVSAKWGHVYREPTDEEHAW